MSDVFVRMDRSKPFSTIHGDRGPGDQHQFVQFKQDGLPFDAEGKLLIEAISVDDTKNREKAKRLIERAKARAGGEKAPAVPEPQKASDQDSLNTGTDETDHDSGAGGGAGEVNLEAWLRGEQKWPWFQIAAAIRTRFAKNVTKQADAVQFLVRDEKIISDADVTEAFRSYLTDEA